jgi:ankyrin repeat protein
MKRMVYIFAIVGIISNTIFAMEAITGELAYILVNTELSDGCFPLSCVKNIENCKLLLDHGADPNKLNKQGYTPLGHQVMTPNNNDVIELLLKCGGKSNAIVCGKPLLLYAIELNDVHKVEILLRHGAHVSYDVIKGIGRWVNSEIFSLLMHTVISAKDKNDIIKLLLSHGANPNMYVDGVPLLSKVIELNDVCKVETLLKAGAEVSYDVVMQLGKLVNSDIITLLKQYGSMMMCRSCRESFFCIKEYNGGTFLCVSCVPKNIGT